MSDKTLEEALTELADLGADWKLSDYEGKNYKFVMVCMACPEAYDVFTKDHEEVGYVKLRHGRLRVDVPFGNTIFLHEFPDDFRGIFASEEERKEYLDIIDEKIRVHLEQKNESL